jgi:hypothetical protein
MTATSTWQPRSNRNRLFKDIDKHLGERAETVSDGRARL